MPQSMNKINSHPKYIQTGFRANVTAVWDLPTRAFHWSLVLSVAAALITGFISPEWWMTTHVWAGYFIVMLIVFRIIWGFFGPEYSRISSFVYSVRDTFSHVKGLFLLRPSHYMGHNPLGALMIFVLFTTLVVITATGLVVLGGEENQGPFAGIIHYEFGYSTKTYHLYFSLFLIFLVAVHLGGVIFESWVAKENLVKSMVTGNKIIKNNNPIPEQRKPKPILASIAFGLIILPVAGTLLVLFKLPPTGIRYMVQNETYLNECGDCHQAYHPSLLPKSSWQTIMFDLENHFGEDASLDKSTNTDISRFLQKYASEAWETEAAARLRQISTTNPLRISRSPYWVKKHEDISNNIYKQNNIISKSNCSACHSDATNGTFLDENIQIPKGKVK